MIFFSIEPVQVVQIVVTFILPILVGLVTTRETASSVKAWLLASLALATTLLTGFVEAANADMSYNLGLALVNTIPTFAIAVASYYGLWKPTGVGKAAQDYEPTTLFR